MIRTLAARALLALPMLALLLPGAALPALAADAVTVTHAVSEVGDPKYGPGFSHFDYASPAAPKGGTVSLTTVGSFDSLNLLPIQGQSARSLPLIYESLMTGSQDEQASYYGLLAETVEYPEDLSWAVFNLRSEARFSDGTPVTAHDVAWTIEAVAEHASPFLRSYVAAVADIQILADHRIRFVFDRPGNIKSITQLAVLPIHARHWWQAEGRDIGDGTLEAPVGSGPYRLVEVDAGRRLVYQRDPDHWGADLPVRRGQFNFERIEYTYFRDRTVEFEAFKSGQGDFRQEFTSKFWATGYDVPAVAEGDLITTEVPGHVIRGLQGYFMNLRREQFADPRVRQALIRLFDFEWVNQNLFHGLYDRLGTYFLAPGWSGTGMPSEAELALLEPYRDRLPEAVLTTPLAPPTTDGSGRDRRMFRDAIRLLEEAGYVLRDGRRINAETGEPLTFEVILQGPTFERVTQPWLRNLERVGIEASLRTVDSAQWQRRYQDRAFDVIAFAYTFFPPPGREEADRFGSAAADVPGSANVMGIQDPVVDALLDKAINGVTLEARRTATRALDRVLRAGHYAVPHWHKQSYWVAYWDRFGFPDTQPPYDFGLANSIQFQPTWWVDPAKDAQLAEAR